MSAFRRLLIVLCCAAGGLWMAGPAGRLCVASAVLLVAPGLLLERALPLPGLPLLVRASIWLGASISMVALVYEWATTFGVALSPPLLAVLVCGCGIAALVVAWRADPPLRAFTGVAAMGLLVLANFGLRLYQIRELVLPAWVDSVHHALLIRVALERGQAPLDLNPYLPISQLPYHWGYHVFAAASVALSGAGIPQVMLWQGQFLNSLHVATGGALAVLLWQRRWAALPTAVVIGFLSLMPGFYTSWGRYTQLTGLLLLPALAASWQYLLGKLGLRTTLLPALLLAGLNMVHFRVLVFGLALIAAQTLLALVRGERGVWRLLGLCAAAAAFGVALSAPWLWLLAQQRLAVAIQEPGSFFNGGTYGQLSEGLLWAGPNRWLAALALTVGAWGLRRHATAALVVALWCAALVLLANPELVLYVAPVAALPLAQWLLRRGWWFALPFALLLLLANPLLLRLPTSWLITNDVVSITVFLPIGVLLGGLAVAGDTLWCGLYRRVPRLPERSGLVVGMLACLALAAWGSYNQRSLINPGTVLATAADRAAIDWAAEHTPADARFLVGAAAWLGTADRGTDGGWWLLPLAGRWVSTPPVLFDYGPADYVQATRARTHAIAALQPDDAATAAAIITRDQITYIYLRDSVGPLTRAMFSDTARYQTVYDQNGVAILAVVPQP